MTAKAVDGAAAAATARRADPARAERRRGRIQRDAATAAEGERGARACGEKRKRPRGTSAGRLPAREPAAAAPAGRLPAREPAAAAPAGGVLADSDDSSEAFASAGDDSDDSHDGFASVDDDDDDGDDDDDSPAAFATSMAKILGSTLKVADRKAPILAKSRGIERRIEEEKLESKARKALASERKRLASKDRVLPDSTRLDYESRLKRVAARGVVKLFNAINEHHKADMPDTVGKSAATKEKVASMSKASFLELLKSGKPADMS
ncbi:MAG: Rrp15p-domain-containing protein [Olpidium bornovanus]|uniref:Rrp15p-domain-containing protein n=1 Tax=Olpidium bornovanus TaxID=278681 RepID=A0A8H8DHC6_9FUNG|nr:MAG: Rrp15p-domain-containing protein [Olpidium bornovanus]